MTVGKDRHFLKRSIMKLKKFDLRLKPETINSITQLADKKYFGNRSLCARDLLEKAIDNCDTITLKVNWGDMGRVSIINHRGDTYTSGSDELIDFIISSEKS